MLLLRMTAVWMDLASTLEADVLALRWLLRSRAMSRATLSGVLPGVLSAVCSFAIAASSCAGVTCRGQVLHHSRPISA